MKKLLRTFLLTLLGLPVMAQITTPVTRAGFGVDGELRANFFNGFIQSGSDDWFNNGVPGTGQFVIDTLGAAKMMNRFAADPAARRLPFYRTMRVPQFSIVNNRIWIDAVYIRDYNGQSGGDSTAFVNSNKNGDSPADWNGGVTSVLDKNDIAEMMVHVRRAGPSKTDSLWMMGGISLQGTTGNRYFDFELYQTDIFYSRTTGKFSNYGPDAGHTSWQFDAAGNITVPGDVIFTAEYSSSSLTSVEARIWVDRAALSITPATFDWGGSFEGASTGSQFGYANIVPKTAGTYYTGLQSGNGTWAGPFGFIDGGNNLQTTYSSRQYMEFSVNLSKLGLDPITLLGGSACGLPFRRILVKTRTSTSFSSELKDFIGPFDFFTAPPVKAVADVPVYCGVMGASEISVVDPASASVYTWTTPDGHIVTSPSGPSITVDMPGTYVVTQQLLDGCSSYASDTVVITYDATCVPMENKVTRFRGIVKGKYAEINWFTRANNETEYFELQRSLDGINFETVAKVNAVPSADGEMEYIHADDISAVRNRQVFYRLKSRMGSAGASYTGVLKLNLTSDETDIQLFPNPVSDVLQLSIPSAKRQEVQLNVYDIMGSPVKILKTPVREGVNMVQVETADWKPGAYIAIVKMGSQTVMRKFVIQRNIAY